LEDRSPLVRAAVAEALGQQLDQPNATALLKATADDYRLVRVRAAAALDSVPRIACLTTSVPRSVPR